MVFALALTGCNGDDDVTPGNDNGNDAVDRSGGTLSFFLVEPAGIDPYNVFESEGIRVAYAVFETLIRSDQDNPAQLIPAAATSWESNEDATVWTFNLDPNGQFSDGTPVTTADFIFAWNRVASLETRNTIGDTVDPSVIADQIDSIKGFAEMRATDDDGNLLEDNPTEMSGLVALDDHTLEVTLVRPFADFEYLVTHPALSPVPQYFVENGVEFEGETVPFGEMPIGNGPFKMAEPWARDQYIDLVRNDNYSGAAPYLDGISFRIFVDSDTAYNEFLAGNLDFTQIGQGRIDEAKAQFGVSPDGYTANPGEQVLTGPIGVIQYIAINNDVEPFDNIDLRRAISLAINRQAIVDIPFEGTRATADSFIPPGFSGAIADGWADARFDRDAAAAALADAGFPEGEGLGTIQLGFNAGGGHEQWMELVQADLAEIGITAEFNTMEWAAYLEALQTGNYQTGRLGWSATYASGFYFLEPNFKTDSADNISGFGNPEIDTMLEEAMTILDVDARDAKMQEIHRLIGEEMPVVPVMFAANNHVVSDRLNNFNLNSLDIANFRDVWISAEDR
jgi:peptide/nickel transport system substrate-binding protein/oligopeptide transport system substrate-binding protein